MMLIKSLIHRFRFLNAEPDAGGTGTGAPAAAPAAEAAAPAPAADVAEAAAAPAATPAPAPAADQPEPDPFATLTTALENVGKPEAAPTPAPTPAPTAAPVAGKPAAPAPEVDFTPPEGMSERATQRWAQLTERAKLVPELERRASEASEQLQSVRTMVNASGMDANEFTEMLEMARLFKQGDPKALQQLDGLRADLAGRLGVEVAGVDPLEKHPDLKAEVEAMTLPKERALEIARLRGKGQQADAMTAEDRQRQQFTQTVNTAAANMEKTLATRAGTPGHQEKINYIGALFKDPAKLQKFVATYRPEQWEGALLDIYDAYTPPTATAAPAVPQPLRPGTARAGAPARSGPVTAESAVEGAFSRAGL